jgi:hypothetical protein
MHSLFGSSQMFHYNLFKEFLVSIVGRNADAISWHFLNSTFESVKSNSDWRQRQFNLESKWSY